MKFATNTGVDVTRSRAELERLVLQNGAKMFTVSVNDDAGLASIAFKLQNHALLFELKLPQRNEKAFTQYKLGSVVKLRTPEQAYKLWEQACRSRWRALLLAVKAKLVAVSEGVETFEEAFLSSIVVNDAGRTARFGPLAVKAIVESYSTGRLPQLGAGSP